MSDKTFTEVCGEAPFDWWKALENPEQFDHDELVLKASSWVTCACGNQCAIIPRTDVIKSDDIQIGGMPKDGALSFQGVAFASCVVWLDWAGAKRALAAIEARSAVLIAEELAKRNQQPA